MKINELRIGNYVKCLWLDKNNYINEYVTINNIDKNGVSYKEAYPHTGFGINMIKPIPLTEKWLLKFGFSDKDYKPGWIGIDVKLGNCLSDFPLAKPTELIPYYHFMLRIGDLPLIKELHFVHQLQNWFYEFTDNELTLK